jgi:hypothetical protein
VDHQGAQHSTKIGSFCRKASERALAKSSWMKGSDAAPAVTGAAAKPNKTQSKSFLMCPLKGNCKKKWVFFPDPFSIDRMGHLCGDQKVYSCRRFAQDG